MGNFDIIFESINMTENIFIIWPWYARIFR